MWGWRGSASTSVHIASNMRAASSPLSAREENVRASGFSFPSLPSVFGSFFNCRGRVGGMTCECSLAHVGAYVHRRKLKLRQTC